MNIIIPMAGMGKRMRPHTLTTPKPLVPVAGRSIVQHLVEDLAKMVDGKIDEIGFIIGDFGKEVEESLIKIAEKVGAKGKIFYQDEALGTAHAVFCAEELLKENVIIAFADTIFRADFKVDHTKDGIIWVNKVDNPQQFGVVQLDNNNVITNFVEKPSTFVSDLAIIGIYYIRDGANLRSEIKYLIDNDIKEKGEYQLTNALENMKAKGLKFEAGTVLEWLDCGNKNATVYTNKRVLEIKPETNSRGNSVHIENSVIIEPCFIGDQVKIYNSVVGPHVSLGSGTEVKNSRIENSIILNSVKIVGANLDNSLIGNSTEYNAKPTDISLGDYSTIIE